MKDSFFIRIWKKAPVLFPLAALYHVVMLAYSVHTYSSEPFPSKGWVQPLWMLCYTVAWLFVSDMKRWAALTYLGLTTLNLVLRFALTDINQLSYYTDTLFPIDVLFTFFVMFYFKRFD